LLFPPPFPFREAALRCAAQLSDSQPASVPAAHHTAYRKGLEHRRIPLLRLALLGLALGLVSLLVPQVFRFAARYVIAVTAWRHGVTVTIHRVQGSLYEPLVLVDSVWERDSASGVSTRFEIKRATAD